MRALPLALLAVLSAAPLHAGDVTAEFSFTKRAPKVALVYFPEDASAPTTAVTVDQADKQFSKLLVVAPKGTQLSFKNSDAVQHNIFADDKDAGVSFDSGLADPGATTGQEIDWDEGKIVRIGCKIHPKMSMYGGSVASKHYTIVEFNKETTKSVTLAGVPDGLTKVKIWIARFDPQEATLAPGGTATVELTRKGKPYGTLTLKR